MKQPRVETLLLADKGRKAGQFAVPPVQNDSAAYPFAVAHDGRIAVCNNAHLILMDPNRRARRLLKAPLGERTEFWGIACTHDSLVAVLSDYTIAVMDWDGRVRQRFGRGFGDGENQINGAPPFRMVTSPSGAHCWLQGDNLYRISLNTERIERAFAPERGNYLTGLALNPSGRACVSSEEPIDSTAMFQWQETPQSVKKLSSQVRHWSLFGIDLSGNFYWHGSRFEKRERYLIEEVACVAPDERLRWHLVLNGASGVVHSWRSPSQVQWLEVDRQGRLYVLGWAYAGIRKRVGLFRIEMR